METPPTATTTASRNNHQFVPFDNPSNTAFSETDPLLSYPPNNQTYQPTFAGNFHQEPPDDPEAFLTRSPLREQSSRRSWNPEEVWREPVNNGIAVRRRSIQALWRRPTKNYDEGNERALMVENNGLRIWYGDYTTIDWIHDNLKESVRLRQLRSLPGLSGTLQNAWDASQAWMLVTIIGAGCGVIAAVINISSAWLSDLKSGYCSTSIWMIKEFCCSGTGGTRDCGTWNAWSGILPHPLGPDNAYRVDYTVYIFMALLYATISAALVKYTAIIFVPSTDPKRSKRRISTVRYFAAGSGLPEIKIILGGFVIRGFLGLKTLWVKSIGLIFSVASGLTIGMSAPLVHIACCFGNVACRLSNKYETNEGKRREILSAASAAGIAVAFGAPIGGVLFSLEEVSYYFPSKTMWRSFFCAMIAAMTLKLINPLGGGKLVKFQVTYDTDWKTFELLVFLLLGLFGGVYGAIFSKLNIAYQRMRATTILGQNHIREVMVVAVFTAMLNSLNQFTQMSLVELVAQLFKECVPGKAGYLLCVGPEGYTNLANELGLTVIVRILLTIVTFGIKVPAGAFIPSMCVGACFGRLLGIGVLQLQHLYPNHAVFSGCTSGQDCIIPGVYALVGGAAALAGVTRMTVSLVVIMFELTGALTYVLPIMIAIMVSKWVADFLCKRGLYDLMIEMNDHPYLDSKKEYIHTKSLADIVNTDKVVINVDDRNDLVDLEGKLAMLDEAAGGFDTGFPILFQGQLMAYIAANELEHAIAIFKGRGENVRSYFGSTETDTGSSVNGKVNDFTPYLDQAPLTVSINASMELVLELFVKLGVRYLCVNHRNGKFVGVIDKKRLLMYLRQL